jgi:hypothetical protein
MTRQRLNEPQARLIRLAHAQAGNENGDREVFEDEECWKLVQKKAPSTSR